MSAWVQTLLNILTIGRFDSISDQITQWASNSIETNREEELEAARKKTAEEERTRKEEEEQEEKKERLRKDEEERKEGEKTQQNTLEVEEAYLQADEVNDVAQTPSPASGSQDPEDGEQQPSGTQRSTKPSTPLPTQSALEKGSPQGSSSAAPSPRSQSPAPTHVASPVATSHSRRPSALLRQGVSITDGVSVSRNHVGSIHPLCLDR
ncbi:hypothetical protein EDB19DRAFT_189876 [Suillus lakei]|nr:hypothetical protein EDB19DRAFT_189876 [Suillus lakei]